MAGTRPGAPRPRLSGHFLCLPGNHLTPYTGREDWSGWPECCKAAVRAGEFLDIWAPEPGSFHSAIAVGRDVPKPLPGSVLARLLRFRPYDLTWMPRKG